MLLDAILSLFKGIEKMAKYGNYVGVTNHCAPPPSGIRTSGGGAGTVPVRTAGVPRRVSMVIWGCLKTVSPFLNFCDFDKPPSLPDLEPSLRPLWKSQIFG